MASMTAKHLACNLAALETTSASAESTAEFPATSSQPATVPESTAASEANVTMSALKRKISLFSPASAQTVDLPTTITDLTMIADLYRHALCPQCKLLELQLCHKKARDQSFAVFLELRCSVCDEVIGQTYT
ncbi:hypothetical protein PoB_002391200 [Plakobranchus ocellatus]|uniref:Uncharacterized protein n=1 Tax=Plakobranchus ocellatus TaxID=259542 RepID=A0AAV3ZRW9_9GAST|nr:hypothetical protein PoB_002391200 [Plakobranchus ocellatus]